MISNTSSNSEDDISPPVTAPLTTMASAMMFGSVIFASVALATRSFIIGDYRPFQAARNPRSSPLDLRSFSSVYTFLQHVSVFGLILFYAYICENHPPFAHSDKHYDADQFFFLTGILFVVSAYTVKNHDSRKKENMLTPTSGAAAGTAKNSSCGVDDNARCISAVESTVAESNDSTEILNRDQTEEWKGWMQFCFLLYHYYHAEEVYNAIRIMITCYVWMTGFGNFSFFYLKADYGWVRVLQMLWRLNFLVLFLCLTQGTTYMYVLTQYAVQFTSSPATHLFASIS